jgi:hypothetical protein
MPKVRASPVGRGRLEPDDKSFYKQRLLGLDKSNISILQ